MPDRVNTVGLYALGFLFLVAEVFFAYYLDRSDFGNLLGTYLIMFLCYLILVRFVDSYSWILVALIVVSRLCLLFAVPNLSDDFYRFIWDGRLLNMGIDPFSFTPSDFTQGSVLIQGLNDNLYSKLNSPEYFTIYPPISQMVFWLSAALFPMNIQGSVIVMKLVIILADFGVIYLLYQLIKAYSLPKNRLLIYALNPLVIIELSGNLHFEAIMLFFVVLSIWLIQRSKFRLSAAALALGVATKLIPLMFLPGLIRKVNIRTLIQYFGIVGIVTLMLFIITFDPSFILGFSDSLDLFFRKFEFNGGIFFLVREVGFIVNGYDIIEKAGPALALTAIEFIIIYSVLPERKKASIPLIFATILFIQLAMATTVHPWYIVPLIALGTLSGLWFPVVWSLLIFMTYFGYSESGFNHPYQIIAIEYIIVLPVAIFELFSAHKIQLSTSNAR